MRQYQKASKSFKIQLLNRLFCFKFMNEGWAHKSEVLITFAWARHSTARHSTSSPTQLCQSISVLTCNAPAAFPILGFSWTKTANTANRCQTIWWFCDMAKWGLCWDEMHLHLWAQQRSEPRWNTWNTRPQCWTVASSYMLITRKA